MALGDDVRAMVTFRAHDVRAAPPAGPFDVIACRNLAFTYFDPPTRRAVGQTLAGALAPGGVLVIGRREHLPDGLPLRPIAPAVFAAC